MRLCGEYETSQKEYFSFGIADRSASIRIPALTAHEGKGFIEDRRPAADVDPYLASAVMADTMLLKESMVPEIIEHFKKWQ